MNWVHGSDSSPTAQPIEICQAGALFRFMNQEIGVRVVVVVPSFQCGFGLSEKWGSRNALHVPITETDVIAPAMASFCSLKDSLAAWP